MQRLRGVVSRYRISKESQGEVMPRVPVIEENEDGWSDWIYPSRFFREFCCHCGLAHDIEYRITDDGIAFRAKQNNRATAAARRKKKK